MSRTSRLIEPIPTQSKVGLEHTQWTIRITPNEDGLYLMMENLYMAGFR